MVFDSVGWGFAVRFVVAAVCKGPHSSAVLTACWPPWLARVGIGMGADMVCFRSGRPKCEEECGSSGMAIVIDRGWCSGLLLVGSKPSWVSTSSSCDAKNLRKDDDFLSRVELLCPVKRDMLAVVVSFVNAASTEYCISLVDAVIPSGFRPARCIVERQARL